MSDDLFTTEYRPEEQAFYSYAHTPINALPPGACGGDAEAEFYKAQWERSQRVVGMLLSRLREINPKDFYSLLDRMVELQGIVPEREEKESWRKLLSRWWRSLTFRG
jgi:hypothetical protein